MRRFRVIPSIVVLLLVAACAGASPPTAAPTVPLPTFVQGTALPTVAPTPTPTTAPTASPSPIPVGTPSPTPSPSTGSSGTDVSGSWTGAWQDSKHPNLIKGTFQVTFTQTDGSFTGTISITNACVSDGTVSGTIDSSGAISFGAVEGSQTITFTGQLSGDSMSGDYSAPGVECGNGTGTWSATRD